MKKFYHTPNTKVVRVKYEGIIALSIDQHTNNTIGGNDDEVQNILWGREEKFGEFEW